MRSASIHWLRRSSFGFLLPLLWLANSQAANPEWFARPWQSEDGLPNNTVWAVAQTDDGYLWLGTPSELVRFDGIEFEAFSPTNYIAPPNRGVLAMLRGRNGALWLGLDRGAVVCLNGAESRTFTEQLPNTLPSGLAEDATGAIWIAYSQGELCRLKEGRVAVCGSKQEFPAGPEPFAVASDIAGTIWAFKSGELGTVSNGHFRLVGKFGAQPAGLEGPPARLAACRQGGVWLCAGNHLFRVGPEGQARDLGAFRPERPGTGPSALLEDRQGAVWIGTTFSGVFRHGSSGFEGIETTHQEVTCLTEDREGNIWVGTTGGGLNCLRRRVVVAQGVESGLPFAAVQSICEDTNGDLWAATQNGVLARRTAGKWSSFSSQEGWPADASCVAAGRDGAVWIGTRSRKLLCWQGGRLTAWGRPEQLQSRVLHTLLASRSGDLWIGGERPNSIQRLRQGQLTSFEVPPDSRVIRAMTEDGAGNIWAATSKGLLFRIAADKLAEVRLRPAGELASIRCLYPTGDGALWIGYAGWGLGRLKEGRYTEIGPEQGLYDGYISHMIADTHGWLWFGADRGLFKVRQEELEDLAEGRNATLRSIRYGRSEGLPSLQGNFGGAPDAVRSRDGKLWIPMRTALAVVDPEQIVEGSRPPAPLLREVVMDDRVIASYAGALPRGPGHLDLGRRPVELTLPPQHRRLELRFAAPNFTAPENVHFRYSLEGSDEGWVEAGTRRSATYSRLPAGAYRFRVGVSGAEGRWVEMGVPLVFTVRPFFWQAWWFRLPLLTGFSLGLAALVRYVSFRRLHRRLQSLEAQAALHKERARIAKDIHDDLGASLTQIALLGELAYQDRIEPDKAAARIDKISRTAREAVRSLDEIVWAVNPRNDTLAHLIDYAGQFALDYLRLAGVRCRLDFPDQAPPHELSTDLRHNLFLVIKEGLNNIVKHARASEVWLRASVKNHSLEFAVEDNGRGFSVAPDNSVADGLRNMRQRMTDVGGELQVESREGSGTRLVLRLPLPQPRPVGLA